MPPNPPSVLLSVIGGLSAALVLHTSIVSSPSAEELEQQEQDEIAAEDRAFCERFGMPVNTPDYLVCAEALDSIRANHEKRRAYQTQGLL